MIDLVLLVSIGLVAGALAASLGIGGGIVFVAALALILGFDQHLAQGTSLAVIVPTALVATVGHARSGRVVWRLAIPTGAAGILGGLIGARTALAIEGELLRRLFAIVLLVISVRLAIRSWHLYRGSD